MSRLFTKIAILVTKKDIINQKLGVDKWKSFVPCALVLTSKKLNFTNNYTQNDEGYAKMNLLKLFAFFSVLEQ